MTEPTRIFHNPRCSKSRQALELLTSRGIRPDIIRYLDTPPTAQELDIILRQLALEPRQLIAAMVANPRLIERPIVQANGKAVIGRPPENVLTIV